MSHDASLDTQMLDDLKELLGESFNELINRYLSDSSARFALLQTAVASQDFKTIYYEAHGVKGSSRNMGANKLAEICGKLEALGHGQNFSGVPELLEQAQAEYAHVSQLLEGFRI
jgi:histidine phosphotransfer protein HptB